jgi:hypothetical protein
MLDVDEIDNRIQFHQYFEAVFVPADYIVLTGAIHLSHDLKVGYDF